MKEGYFVFIKNCFFQVIVGDFFPLKLYICHPKNIIKMYL